MSEKEIYMTADLNVGEIFPMDVLPKDGELVYGITSHGLGELRFHYSEIDTPWRGFRPAAGKTLAHKATGWARIDDFKGYGSKDALDVHELEVSIEAWRMDRLHSVWLCDASPLSETVKSAIDAAEVAIVAMRKIYEDVLTARRAKYDD